MMVSIACYNAQHNTTITKNNNHNNTNTTKNKTKLTVIRNDSSIHKKMN